MIHQLPLVEFRLLRQGLIPESRLTLAALASELCAALPTHRATATHRHTGRRLRRRGRHNRFDNRNSNDGRESERPNHRPPIHSHQRRRPGGLSLKQVIAAQLIKSQPDNLFINGTIELPAKSLRNLRGGVLTIAVLPDKCRRRVEAMSTVAVEIVNQHLVGAT